MILVFEQIQHWKSDCDRAFPVAAACAWTNLSSFVTSASSMSTDALVRNVVLMALTSAVLPLFLYQPNTSLLFCVCYTCPCINQLINIFRVA